MNKAIILVLCSLLSVEAFSQSDTTGAGSICIMRSTGFTGSAKKYKLFMDGRFMCKIPNNSYVKYSVDPGEHSFAVQTGGKELWPATEQVEVSVTVGGTSFLSIAMAMGMVDTRLSLNEVAEKNAEPRMKKLRQVECTGK